VRTPPCVAEIHEEEKRCRARARSGITGSSSVHLVQECLVPLRCLSLYPKVRLVVPEIANEAGVEIDFI